jgi:hypothetical protein
MRSAGRMSRPVAGARSRRVSGTALLLAAVLSVGWFGSAASAAAATAPPALTSPGVGVSVFTAVPKVAGTGEIGDTVIVTERDRFRCAAIVAQDSTWHCLPSIALENGTHVFTAMQIDQTGELSAASAPVSFTVAAPEAGPAAAPSTPSGLSAAPPPHHVPTPLAIAAIVALALTFASYAFVSMRPRSA